MDFSWSDEQITLRDSAIKFAKRELNYDVIELDKRREFPSDAWKRCADFGINGLTIPEQYGGRGLDLLTAALVMEGLGYGCKDNGLIFALNAQLWSVAMPILKFGTDAQKERFLPKLSSGEYIGVHGATEPGSGSDIMSLQTTAERRGHRYILNGSKTFITSASIADVALTLATVNKKNRLLGLTALLVEKGAPGFSVSRDIDKMGLRTSPMGELVFSNCEVPAENRLGNEGRGLAIFTCAMDLERSCILASYLGTMQRQLEECVAYARRRRQFGQPIGKFQSISHRIAYMKVRLESARDLVYRACWLQAKGKPPVMESAIAKLYLSECLVRSSLDALQIHGAYGYMTESEVERNVRDSLAATLYSGTSEIQRNIIARTLGL